MLGRVDEILPGDDDAVATTAALADSRHNPQESVVMASVVVSLDPAA
jgi:hypothetical protein